MFARQLRTPRPVAIGPRRSLVSRALRHARAAGGESRIQGGTPTEVFSGEAGFTVLELVVVMLVVGILAAVVLPRMSQLDSFDQVGYRDRVVATLEYARKAAVAQRRKVQVTLAAGSVTVLIASDVPEGAAANTFDRSLLLPGSGSNTFTAPAGVTLSGTPGTLVFDALGQPSAAGSYTITGSSTPIVVEAVTGYVH